MYNLDTLRINLKPVSRLDTGSSSRTSSLEHSSNKALNYKFVQISSEPLL